MTILFLQTNGKKAIEANGSNRLIALEPLPRSCIRRTQRTQIGACNRGWFPYGSTCDLEASVAQPGRASPCQGVSSRRTDRATTWTHLDKTPRRQLLPER